MTNWLLNGDQPTQFIRHLEQQDRLPWTNCTSRGRMNVPRSSGVFSYTSRDFYSILNQGQNASTRKRSQGGQLTGMPVGS